MESLMYRAEIISIALFAALVGCEVTVQGPGPDDITVPGTYTLTRIGPASLCKPQNGPPCTADFGVATIVSGSIELRENDTFTLTITDWVASKGVERTELEVGTYTLRESDDPLYIFEVHFVFSTGGRFGDEALGTIHLDAPLFNENTLFLLIRMVRSWTFERWDAR